MCESRACSVEHVPPRALFPEQKDIGHRNYRKNLMTVPSCATHNMLKSGDDEFLMVSLSGLIGANWLSLAHKYTKVERADRRSKGRLSGQMFKKPPVLLELEANGERFEVHWGQPDHPRLVSCFDKIARGVAYWKFGKRFLGETKPLLGYLLVEDESAKNFQQFVKDKADVELEGSKSFGENPEVFYFQHTEPDNFGLWMIRLTFFEGLRVYVSMIPTGTVLPSHLGLELMNRGIETHFVLGEKTYRVKLEDET